MVIRLRDLGGGGLVLEGACGCRLRVVDVQDGAGPTGPTRVRVRFERPDGIVSAFAFAVERTDFESFCRRALGLGALPGGPMEPEALSACGCAGCVERRTRAAEERCTAGLMSEQFDEDVEPEEWLRRLQEGVAGFLTSVTRETHEQTMEEIERLMIVVKDQVRATTGEVPPGSGQPVVDQEDERMKFQCPVNRYTGGFCAVCGQKQFRSPSGVTCANGHGGAEPGSSVKPPVVQVQDGETRLGVRPSGADRVDLVFEDLEAVILCGRVPTALLDEFATGWLEGRDLRGQEDS